MSLWGRHPLFFSTAAICFLLVTGFFSPLPARAVASGVFPPPPRFSRPAVPVIRQTTQKILDDPQLAPRKTFWQIIYEWFESKFKDAHFPRLSEGLASVLLWSLILWCILALLAILCHLAWTILTLLRKRSGRVSGAWSHLTLLSPEQNMTYEELMARITELSARGEFRQAAALLMIALFKHLDQVGLVCFHESKTNGDYLREFPTNHLGRTELRQLALAFDETVYGGKNCDLPTYRQLYAFFERIQIHVGHQP
jgi:hypothetical protein